MSMLKQLPLTTLRLIRIHDMGNRPWYQWFKERVGTPDTVLDVCSAYGLWYFGLNQKPEWYIGLEINREYVSQGGLLGSIYGVSPVFIRMDVHQQPWVFRDRWFDQVWMNSWWVCEGDLNGVVSEASRVLKDDGVLFLMVPDWLRDQVSIKEFRVVDLLRFRGYDAVWCVLYQLQKRVFR